jgi:predicted RNA-binding protein
VIAQPGVKYQWKRNGEIIAIDVNQVSVTETGVYTVAVFDSCGLVNASNSISIQLVEKLAPPTITVDGNPVLCEGGNVSLRVPASLGISYQWKRDGVVIPGATSAAYRATASGSYTVEVRNACGATLSENSIAVTVEAKPEAAVISANGPVTFCPGGSVVLSVPAVPGVSYQWRWFGTVVGTNTNSLLATVPGSYSVVLSNSCGIVSSANTIEVGEIQTPVPVIREKNLVLTVSVEGTNYVWLDSLGLPVPNASGPQFIPTAPGFYRVAVTFANGCTRVSEAVYWPSGTLGIANELSDIAITVYPVPATQGEVLQLRFEGNYAMPGSPDFVMYSASGVEVMRGKLMITSGQAMINTEKLTSGNYLLVLAGHKTMRVIISQ